MTPVCRFKVSTLKPSAMCPLKIHCPHAKVARGIRAPGVKDKFARPSQDQFYFFYRWRDAPF